MKSRERNFTCVNIFVTSHTKVRPVIEGNIYVINKILTNKTRLLEDKIKRR